MRNRLIVLTVILGLAILATAIFPGVVAVAKAQQNTIVCEKGYELTVLADGRVKIVGECGLEDAKECPIRPDDNTIVYSPYDEAYPEPDNPYPEVYPEPYDAPEACLIPWLYGQECNP